MGEFVLDDILAPGGVLSKIMDIKSYTGEDCIKCGRHRVELITVSSGNSYHVCEKCGWIRELNRYLKNLSPHCDEHIEATITDEECNYIRDVDDYCIAEEVYGE